MCTCSNIAQINMDGQCYCFGKRSNSIVTLKQTSSVYRQYMQQLIWYSMGFNVDKFLQLLVCHSGSCGAWFRNIKQNPYSPGTLPLWSSRILGPLESLQVLVNTHADKLAFISMAGPVPDWWNTVKLVCLDVYCIGNVTSCVTINIAIQAYMFVVYKHFMGPCCVCPLRIWLSANTEIYSMMLNHLKNLCHTAWI